MRQLRYVGTILLCLWVFAFESGCGARSVQASMSEMYRDVGPGPLIPLDDTHEDFFAEHQVDIQWADKSRSFRAVLQQRSGLLELILLGPMEQPVVRVFQKHDEVGVEQLVQGPLPFEPEYILADVQKAFFKWPVGPASDAETSEGSYETLRWKEQRENEVVQWREFRRDDLPHTLPLRVDYTYEEGDTMPSSVRLENTWVGYTLYIRTIRWSPL